MKYEYVTVASLDRNAQTILEIVLTNVTAVLVLNLITAKHESRTLSGLVEMNEFATMDMPGRIAPPQLIGLINHLGMTIVKTLFMSLIMLMLAQTHAPTHTIDLRTILLHHMGTTGTMAIAHTTTGTTTHTTMETTTSTTTETPTIAHIMEPTTAVDTITVHQNALEDALVLPRKTA